MKQEKKNKKILIHPLYTVIIWLVLAFTSLTFMLLPSILWKNNQSDHVWEIAFYAGLSSLFLLCIHKFIHCTQIAYVSQKGITIKNLYGIIANIEWREIEKVTIEKLLTYDSRGQYFFEWIVIRTDKSQERTYKCVDNKKNVAPWYIFCNKKNNDKFQKALKLYRSDLKLEKTYIKHYKS